MTAVPPEVAPLHPARDEIAARVVIGVIALVLTAAIWTVELPQFWGDGATYHGMAWSLAEDFDTRYEARDIARTRREFPTGPQGIFLKRAHGGLDVDLEAGFPWLRRVTEDDQRVYYAKAFIYPLVAAPFVRVFGTRGLLLANLAALMVALALVYTELRRQASPAAALATATSLLLLTVTPIYVLWPAPEIFNLGVLTAALVSWRRGWPLLSAVLFGIAFYSKPYNLFVAAPLGLEPLFAGPGFQGMGRRVLEMLRRGAVLAAVGFGLFALNAVVTGEANYQGGFRKTFYGASFPFEFDVEKGRLTTLGNSGIWMTTMQLGPSIEGAENVSGYGAEPPRSVAEIRSSFLHNLYYFWLGRFGGAVPYFLPAVVALLLFLLRGPRERAGFLALAALALSWLFYVWMIPDNWYGGGGTVGNRYFLNLLPLALFFVPRGREWLVAASGLAGAIVFLLPIFRAPLTHSLRPGDHATRGAFKKLPAELTMLNDLSVFTEPWRKKRPVGDTEGDPHKHWPAGGIL